MKLQHNERGALRMQLIFGYDLSNIEKVQSYLQRNYKEGVHYNMHIGIGEDIMNGVDLKVLSLRSDKKLIQLVNECEGNGEWID